MATHPYKPSDHSEEKPRYTGVSDLDDLLDQTISVASGIGAGVLASISGALEQVGEAIGAARQKDENLPFPKWKRRMDRQLQKKNQDDAVALAVVGWTLASCFGIAAIVMWALSAAGPQALNVTLEEFMVFPILMACFTPLTVGFGIMGGVGVKKYRYINRLRRYLRVARDWVSDVVTLAGDSAFSREQVQRDLQQAIARGELPDAVLEQDGKLYLDITRCAPERTAPQSGAETAPQQEEPVLDDAGLLQRDGAAFLDYLARSTGKLGEDADEELETMRKNCAAILGFVHNHPEQLPRVRRLREYYLPTTCKLLDTAQGLGNTETENAREIRRDITGILHTLNQAYAKLYDTLLQDISLDVSTEIGTLETMLRQDGLTHDFETDFKNA